MHLADRVRMWLQPWHGERQTEQSVQVQAEAVFRSLWEQTARSGSTRHPFHPEVLNDLDVLLDKVAAADPDTVVMANDRSIRWGDVPERHPNIVGRLTPDWIRNFVISEVARVSAVADSTEYLTAGCQEELSGRIRHKLTVQHRLSGLRAALSWNDGEEFGDIVAKSYRIPSIDPDRSWDGEGSQAVREWQGLGITTRLYQHGASLQPEIRWRITTLTDQSAGLRRRLHQIDPWRFAADWNAEYHPDDACLWCIEHGWADLDQAGFTSHPGNSTDRVRHGTDPAKNASPLQGWSSDVD